MSSASPCPDRPALWKYLLAEVGEDEAETLEAHLLECQVCCSIARSMSPRDTLVEALRQGPTLAEDAEGDLVAALLGRLSSPDVAESTPVTRVAHAGDGASPPWLSSLLAPAQTEGELGRLGDYRVLKVLGHGGMGVVFLAEDTNLQRGIALKVMGPALAEVPESRDRFLREARAAAAVAHPNIVTVYRVGEDRGVPYLAMQLLEGESLDERLRREGRLPPRVAVGIARQIAAGLAAAHARGLVHRDIKPSNIWLEPRPTCGDSHVKLLDFGLVWAAADTARLTHTGALVGTPAFVAPELARGDSFDARCDLFSLGCVLYQMCVGQLPFKGNNTLSILLSIALDQPVPPAHLHSDIPEDLSTLILRLLAKDPEKRPASAHELEDSLESIAGKLDSPEIPPLPLPRPSRKYVGRFTLAAAVVLLGTLALIGYHAARRSPAEAGIDGGERSPQVEKANEAKRPDVQPTAILAFEERGEGVRGMGPKVGDLLYARLAANPALYLVDRQDLQKSLQEQALNLSGLVKESDAIKAGRLTGAKILVTGSVSQVDRKIYLIARIIGTETGRVFVASADGKTSDDLGPLIDTLADRAATVILRESGQLVPTPESQQDRMKELARQLGKGRHPVVWVKLTERHVGAPSLDPAAQTEFIMFCRACGFDVIDPDEGSRAKADLIITGEGVSENGGRHGNLATVKARLEVKVVARASDKVIAVDRQTSVAVDLTEQIAAKTALQNAAADIALRLLPELAK
jgi:serine/threonine protein kinase